MKDDKYKYYTCRYDAAFKEVFLQKDTSLLKIFLENILKIKINRIEIANGELNNKNINVKRKLVDSIIYTDEGVFNVEVNTSIDDSVRVRNACYIMNVYSNQFLKGDSYNSITKYIQINLNYNDKRNKLMDEYKIRNIEGEPLVGNFQIFHFNMDKYMEFWYNRDKEEIEKNKYLIMLDLSKEDLVALSKEDKVVTDYMEKLDNINEDPRFQSYMSAEEDDRKLLNTYKEKAEKAYEKATVDYCISLYNNGVDIKVIAESLSLSIDEVRKILSK